MDAYSQGSVYFGNYVNWATSPTGTSSRPIYYYWDYYTGTGTKLVNDGDKIYKAQLYFAAGANVQDTSLIPAVSLPRDFFSMPSLAGFFSSVTVIFTNSFGQVIVPSGSTATLQVRAWDSVNNTYNTFEEALVAGKATAKSLPFNYNTSELFMEGFQSFSFLYVPEPSSMAFVILGGGVAWILRKQIRPLKR